MKSTFLLSFFFLVLLLATTEIKSQTYILSEDLQQQFITQFPECTFLWNEKNGMPHRAFGKPIPIPGYTAIDRENIEAASIAFLQHLPGWSTSVQPELLRAVFINNYWYVSFVQKINDAIVWNSEIELRINSRGHVAVFGFDVFTPVSFNQNEILSPANVKQYLHEFMINDGFGIIQINKSPVLYLLPFDYQGVPKGRLFYQIDWSAKDSAHAERTWLNAQNGKILRRENRLCQTHITGTVTASYLPELATDIPEMTHLPHLNIHLGDITVVSDVNGNFGAEIDLSTTLTAQLKGPYLNITRFTGNDAAIEMDVNPGDTIPLIWNNTNSLMSERNVFFHTMRTYNFLKSFDPDLTTLDYPLQNIVEDNAATCNAYWNGVNIHYNVEAPNCINSAHSASTIAHEYGHAINDHVYYAAGISQGMSNITLHEAMADVTSCLLLDEHEFAQGFFGMGTFTRDLKNTNRYPENVVGQQHTDGTILAGSFWDLKELTSIETAYRLAHFAKYGTPDDPDLGTALAEYFLEVLLADDDDGDLSNGTPNFTSINEAFCNHGIGLGLFFMETIDHVPLENTLDTTNPYPVTFSYQPPGSGVASGEIVLHYSSNNFQNTNTVLMNSSGNNEYLGEIPSQPEGTIVKYYFTYEEPNCLFTKYPKGEKKSEHFSFLVGNYSTSWKDDFETNQGWTVGIPVDNATLGIWERANPQQVISDANTLVQPGDDHSDPGTRCFVTGAAHGPFWYSFDVDGGRTTLVSPVFSGVGGEHTVIQYYKWYVQGAGSLPPTNDIWRVEMSNNGGSNWVPVEQTIQATNGKWTKVQFKISYFMEPTENMQLRFIASDYNPGSIVEALIDDFEVLVIDNSVATQDKEKELAIRLFPNPAKDYFQLEINNVSILNYEISVFDVFGQQIYAQKINNDIVQINTTNWPEGMYLIQIFDGLKHYTRKIVIN